MSKKPSKNLTIRNSAAEFLIFTNQAGENGIEVRYENETIWFTQKLMAELFDVDVRTISEHLRNIFSSGELQQESVIRKFRTTAADGKNYNTQFRQWTTHVLSAQETPSMTGISCKLDYGKSAIADRVKAPAGTNWKWRLFSAWTPCLSPIFISRYRTARRYPPADPRSCARR